MGGADIEPVEDVLVKPLPRPLYKFVTVSPDWKHEDFCKQVKELGQCINDILRITNWKYICSQMELSGRLHLHALFETTTLEEEQAPKVQKYLHKQHGRPKVPRAVCCNVQQDLTSDNFIRYIIKDLLR